MKTKLFVLAILAAAIGFTACKKGQNEIPEESYNTILTVKLPDNVVARSVQDPVPAETMTVVSNATVFLLKGDAVVGTPVDFTPAEIAAKEKRIEQVSSLMTDVLVVANIPASEAAAVKAVTSLTAFRNFPFSIANQNTGDGVGNKTIFGKINIATGKTDPAPDGHVYKFAPVLLVGVTARLEIGAVKAGTGVADVELVGIWINNYLSGGTAVFNDETSPYWSTTPVTGFSRYPDFDAVAVNTPYIPGQYYDANSASVDLTAGSKVYAYHVFCSTTSHVPHIVMLVKGQFTSEQAYLAGNDYFFGFVTFKTFFDGAFPVNYLSPNRIYRIGVGTTGVAINADDITLKPELQDFDLSVELSTLPWYEKNLTPGV